MAEETKRCPYCQGEIVADAVLCKHCKKEIEEGTLDDDDTIVFSPDDVILSGRYELAELLGQGGFGKVHRVVDRELEDKSFAIKLLPQNLRHMQEALDLIKREANVAIDLSHQRIVKLMHYDAKGNFLVMEYMPGQVVNGKLCRDLHELLRAKGGRLSEEEATRIILQVLEALDYAHSLKEPVIHRDLKPGNILLTETGEVKVGDFGLAKVLRDSLSNISITRGSGTPQYMSPEQCMGERVDARGDIYSVGMTFYQLLAGRTPFTGIDAATLPYHHKNEPVKPIKGVSDRLNEIILKCVAKKPEDRWQSARELADVLSDKVSSPPLPPDDEIKGKNFALLKKSGLPERFVREQEGRWANSDFRRFVKTLETNGYTPIDFDEVRGLVENTAKVYWEELETLRKRPPSPLVWSVLAGLFVLNFFVPTLLAVTLGFLGLIVGGWLVYRGRSWQYAVWGAGCCAIVMLPLIVSEPPPPPPPGPDVAGVWQGTLHQQRTNSTYTFGLDLKQDKSKIEGTSTIDDNSGYSAVMSLSGSVKGNSVQLSEKKILQEKDIRPRSWVWIMKAVNLEHTSGSPETLKGTWSDKRNPSGIHGTISLAKVTKPSPPPPAPPKRPKKIPVVDSISGKNKIVINMGSEDKWKVGMQVSIEISAAPIGDLGFEIATGKIVEADLESCVVILDSDEPRLKVGDKAKLIEPSLFGKAE